MGSHKPPVSFFFYESRTARTETIKKKGTDKKRKERKEKKGKQTESRFETLADSRLETKEVGSRLTEILAYAGASRLPFILLFLTWHPCDSFL